MTVNGADTQFRKWIARICVVGILCWAGFFFGFLVHQSLYGGPATNNWFLQMISRHPAATIGIGISGVSAFFLVAVLEFTVGSMTFKVFGFKFHGAAGQIVLWILCFLAMVFGVWLLWEKTEGA